jgi:hypothetical protein
MVNLKLSRFTDAEPPGDKAIHKINKLGLLAIQWFEKYMETCKDMKTKEVPAILEGHVIRPQVNVLAPVPGITTVAAKHTLWVWYGIRVCQIYAMATVSFQLLTCVPHKESCHSILTNVLHLESWSSLLACLI